MTKLQEVIRAHLTTIPQGKYISTREVTRQLDLPKNYRRYVGIELARHPAFARYSLSTGSSTWYKVK